MLGLYSFNFLTLDHLTFDWGQFLSYIQGQFTYKGMQKICIKCNLLGKLGNIEALINGQVHRQNVNETK